MRCQSPVTIYDELVGKHIAVPCGKCPACLSNRRREWTCRLLAELRNCFSAYFITLTYDNEHLVYADDTPVLMKRDVQLFFKRLRKLINKHPDYNKDVYPLKYVCVGEYGGNTERPHYHICIYNLPYKQEELEDVIHKCWTNGEMFKVGTLTSRSAMYTFKYVLKLHGEDENPYREEFKTFLLASKGVGASWLTKENIDYIKRGKPPDDYNLVSIDRNQYALPRYYRKKIQKKSDNPYIEVFRRARIYKRMDEVRREQFIKDEGKYGEKLYEFYHNQISLYNKNIETIKQLKNKF